MTPEEMRKAFEKWDYDDRAQALEKLNNPMDEFLQRNPAVFDSPESLPSDDILISCLDSRTLCVTANGQNPKTWRVR